MSVDDFFCIYQNLDKVEAGIRVEVIALGAQNFGVQFLSRFCNGFGKLLKIMYD